MATFIGDICINHQGSLEKAKELIEAFSFLDVIKAQKMSPKSFLSPKKYAGPHPNPENAFGKTYGEHKETLEFTVDEHLQLRELCEELGVKYAVSVFDLPSARDALEIAPAYIKIPSCKCNDLELIDFCLENFNGLVHVSTGMTTLEERRKVQNRNNNIVIYSCTSDYRNNGPVYIEPRQGFSCHAPDVIYGMFAVMQGAEFVEYHVTTDRNHKGTDQAVSLLPAEFRYLKEWSTAHEHAIKRIETRKPNYLPKNEIEARGKLWSSSGKASA